MPLGGVQCSCAEAMASLGFGPETLFLFADFLKRSVLLWVLFLIILAVWYLTTVL